MLAAGPAGYDLVQVRIWALREFTRVSIPKPTHRAACALWVLTSALEPKCVLDLLVCHFVQAKDREQRFAPGFDRILLPVRQLPQYCRWYPVFQFLPP